MPRPETIMEATAVTAYISYFATHYFKDRGSREERRSERIMARQYMPFSPLGAYDRAVARRTGVPIGYTEKVVYEAPKQPVKAA